MKKPIKKGFAKKTEAISNISETPTTRPIQDPPISLRPQFYNGSYDGCGGVSYPSDHQTHLLTSNGVVYDPCKEFLFNNVVMPHGSTIHFVSPDGLFIDWTSPDGEQYIVYPSSFFSDENTMEDPDHFDSAGVWRETIAYNPFDPNFKNDYGSAQTMYIVSQAFDLLPIDLQE